MRPADYCPVCHGKGEVLADEGYVDCPACSLRRYWTEADRQAADIEPPEVLVGYIAPDGSGQGNWFTPLEADEAAAYHDAERMESR